MSVISARFVTTGKASHWSFVAVVNPAAAISTKEDLTIEEKTKKKDHPMIVHMDSLAVSIKTISLPDVSALNHIVGFPCCCLMIAVSCH
jgi:hypothetical protein